MAASDNHVGEEAECRGPLLMVVTRGLQLRARSDEPCNSRGTLETDCGHGRNIQEQRHRRLIRDSGDASGQSQGEENKDRDRKHEIQQETLNKPATHQPRC